MCTLHKCQRLRSFFVQFIGERGGSCRGNFLKEVPPAPLQELSRSCVKVSRGCLDPPSGKFLKDVGKPNAGRRRRILWLRTATERCDGDPTLPPFPKKEPFCWNNTKVFRIIPRKSVLFGSAFWVCGKRNVPLLSTQAQVLDVATHTAVPISGVKKISLNALIHLRESF